MMYRIIWWSRAFERMSEIVRAHPDRKDEFATGLRDLTAQLTADPTTAGESREPPYRVGFFGPLTVRFRPVPEDRKVYIVRVHLRRPR